MNKIKLSAMFVCALVILTFLFVGADDRSLTTLSLKELLVETSAASTDYTIVIDPNTKEPKLSLISGMPQAGGVTANAVELNILDGATLTTAELNILDGVTATAAEINDAADKSTAAVVSVTTATLSLTQADHAGKKIVLNKVDGIDLTLPEATGTGDQYFIVLGTALTSDTITITTADTTNADFVGHVMAVDLDAATTAVMFQTIQATGNDIITMNMTTQGGINIGCDYYILTDIGTDLWKVEGKFLVPTGSDPATPFSGT